MKAEGIGAESTPLLIGSHGEAAEKTIEALEVKLRASEARISELEQSIAAQRRMTEPPPSAADVAEREKLRTDLEQQSLELRIFKTLTDQSRDALCIVGMDSKVRYANATFRSMTGFGDRTVGVFTWEFLDEGRTDPDYMEIRPTIAQKGYWEGTMRFRRPDGHIWLPQGTIIPLRDDAGAVYAFIGCYRDATEQIQREEALRESEARLRALFDAIPELIFLLTGDGVYIDYHAEDDDQLLVDRDQIVGRRLEDTLPPEVAARVRVLLREAIATRRPQGIEYSIELRGARYDFEAKVVACSADLVVISARNVTEKRRAEEERRALQAEVIAAKDAALRELATPVVPIAEGVIVMPLIGTIDRARAQQILEALLAGIEARGVRIAILDVTGVRVMDDEVASALVRAAKAARLVGARVMLTGMSPKVAQTLVELQSDLRGILTYGTLQAGIAYALRR